MKGSQFAALILVALLVAPSPALGVVRGSPDIDASAGDNRFVPGETRQLQVTLTNAGDIDAGSAENPSLDSEVTTARGLSATLESGDAPVEIRTGTRTTGSLPEGQTASLPYTVVVDEDADPGTYEVEVEVEYRHTSVIGEATGARNERQITRELEVEVIVEDRARFAVRGAETDARVDATGAVTVTLENVGTEVANDTSVTVESRNGDVTLGGAASATRHAGAWEPGETRTIEYQARIAATGDPQRYALEATATFEDRDGVAHSSEGLSFGVTPSPEQQFRVVSTESDVRIGDTGTLEVTLRNAGPVAVSDATVELRTQESVLAFGESASASRFVGAWEPGENRTVSYDVTATGDAEIQAYALEATVSYSDPQDRTAASDSLSVGVRPAPEMAFALSDVSSSLRVGEEGTVRGTVTNEGETTARDVVVELTTESGTLSPTEREYSVGTLAPGESAVVEYEIDVSEAGSAGPRQFAFVAEYGTGDGDRRTSDDLLGRQRIAPARDRFAVTPAEAAIGTDGSGQLTVEVTNRGNETVRDVSAKLFASDPISTTDDEAFVAALDPGETAELTFGVSASGAQPKAYPLSLDFQYDDADGDTSVSDTYRVPIEVRDSERGGGGLPLTVFGLGAAVVIVGVGGYLRFRD